jgi:hypothetical protein
MFKRTSLPQTIIAKAQALWAERSHSEDVVYPPVHVPLVQMELDFSASFSAPALEPLRQRMTADAVEA